MFWEHPAERFAGCFFFLASKSGGVRTGFRGFFHKNPNTFSILETFGYTEQMCEEYGLLSPAYRFSPRQGCFFCANARKAEMAFIKERHPEVWGKFLALEKEETAFDKWNPFRGTLAEIDAVI